MLFQSYLIFVTGTTGRTRGEKSVMWRNFKFLYLTDVEITEISPHVESFESSPHDICGAIWNILHYQQIMCTIYGVLSHFILLCCKISFIWIYAVLSQNRFVAIYALLRGENLSQKLCPWRKNDKYEVWLWMTDKCMYLYWSFLNPLKIQAWNSFED